MTCEECEYSYHACENKKHVMNDIRYADSILYHYRDNAQPIIDSLLAAGTINQLAAEYYNICFNLRGTDDYENMLEIISTGTFDEKSGSSRIHLRLSLIFSISAISGVIVLRNFSGKPVRS